MSLHVYTFTAQFFTTADVKNHDLKKEPEKMKKEEKRKVYHIRELKHKFRHFKKLVGEVKDNLEIQEFLNELAGVEKYLNELKSTAQLYVETTEN